jgi:WD40 repeat protein/DNA-binding SARP family transcriptional activator
MDFRLLGPVEVTDGQERVPLGGPKPRTLLAHLVLALGRVVPAEQLIDAVWDERPPPAARNTLQTYVSHLRRQLGAERLRARAGGYVLEGERSEVDVYRFEQLLAEARAAAGEDPAAAVQAYGEALAQWRGSALDDLAGQPSLRADIARLEALRLAAVEERLGKELELGRHAEMVAELERLTVRHPLRERLWAHLMVALYRSGRQADALVAFGRARRTLAEELGIDPSPELQRLHEQVLRQDLALEVAGTPLRGYRLLEQLGAGAFGVVHRGFDPQMGREVAIKAIHPRLANDPEFIRRFEAEAQQIARLEHPQVVPLYDYWREPGGAYLVMRYLRGGSLRDALTHGPLDPETALGVLADVGAALGAAHDHGVVHRALKPENILLDEAGNAYLSDFGLATDLPAVDGTVSQRAPPDFRSPEEARGEPATARSDLYSLGLVAYELLAGRHPYAGMPAGQVAQLQQDKAVPALHPAGVAVAAAVDEVIARAMAADPRDRYGDAAELVAALRAALTDAPAPAAAVTGAVTRNPYKGLRAFDEADAGDFCGREALVDQLVARLAEPGVAGRFLAVVGPSGSGKSSLVRAGLVPALRRGAVAGSERWFVAAMLPGQDPFAAFQAALLQVAARPLPANLADQLGRDPRGLVRAATWVLPGDGAELLVVVDQFEEVFTRVEPEAWRVAFLDNLVAAAGDPASRMRVVVTLRADFYDRPLRYPGLAQLVRAHTEAVVPLTAEELERAVSVPARQVGVEVEPGLVARIAADVADQPGALPLVQYALTELFDRRADATTLTLNAYRDIGGVSGALSRRAEALYAALPDPARQATRQLFLRLVTLGEGTEDTRRRVARSELDALPTAAGAMDAAVEAFGPARLLSFDRNPATRQPTVEVAHEALLREWMRLRTWVDRARDDLRTQRRLAAAAGDWVEADRDVSFLAAGSRLEQFAALHARADVALTPDERAFLEASMAERDRHAADEAARQARERELERRSWRRLRALVAVFAAAALIAGGLTVVTLRQTGRLAEQVRMTTARELAAAALANLAVDPERSILLALEAVETARAGDGTVLPEAEEALHRAVKSSRLVRTFPQGGYGLDVSPDGTRLVTTGAHPADNTATVWDLATGEQLLVLVGPDVGRVVALFSPDNRLVATTHNDGTVRLWDAESGAELHVLEGHDGWINLSAFSPDGRWLATTGMDGTVRVWDVAAATEGMMLIGHDGEVFDVAFSPDASRLASISADETIRVWDPTTGETIATLSGWTSGFFHHLAFSPDGSQIAVTSMDRTVRIWDADTGAALTTLFVDAEVAGVAYSPDGTRIAVGASDSTATVWDAGSGRRLLTVAGHTANVTRVAFTPDGQRLLTASLDDTTRIWDLSAFGARDWLTVPGPAGRWATVAFTADGTRFAVPAEPNGVTIHDVVTGDVLVTLSGHDAAIVQGLAFSPDGRRLAAAGFDGDPAARTAPVWDSDSGELLFELDGHDAEIVDVAFSPDGRHIATAGGNDGTVRLWDAASGTEQRVLHVGDEWAGPVAFSPDGRLVAAQGAARPFEGASVHHEHGVFEVATGERVHTLEGQRDWGMGLAFTPDGRLVTTSWEGLVMVWDMSTGQAMQTLHHDTGHHEVAVSPDGTRIATAAEDGTARLWDLDTGRQVLTLYAHDAPVFGVAFSPDGWLLATSSEDGTVALHLLPIDEFVKHARSRVTRDLTDDECRQYLRLQHCPDR